MSSTRDCVTIEAPTVVMVLVPQRDAAMAVTSRAEMSRWRCKATHSRSLLPEDRSQAPRMRCPFLC